MSLGLSSLLNVSSIQKAFNKRKYVIDVRETLFTKLAVVVNELFAKFPVFVIDTHNGNRGGIEFCKKLFVGIGANNVCERRSLFAQKRGDLRFGIFRRLVRYSGVIAVQRNADDLITALLMQFDQVRKLFETGTAPRRPNIKNDDRTRMRRN